MYRLPAACLPVVLALAAILAGCGERYSPDVYATNAAQQASKVEPGVIVGVRRVKITAAGGTGAATGAAAGGIAGSQAGIGPTGALTTLGGLAGVAAEHTVSDTEAFEYVVRKPNGEMVSVTQKDERPMRVGQKVLVISGAQQVRIVQGLHRPARAHRETRARRGATRHATLAGPDAAAPLRSGRDGEEHGRPTIGPLSGAAAFVRTRDAPLARDGAAEGTRKASSRSITENHEGGTEMS